MKSVPWLCCPLKSLHSRFVSNSLLDSIFFFLVSVPLSLIVLHVVHYDCGSPRQVYKIFCTYTEGTGLKAVMAAGQKPFAVEQATLLENR